MNKNELSTIINNVNWFNLSKKGYILSNNNILPYSLLVKKAGVYIYQSLLEKNIAYVGSTCNIAERARQHRHSANNNGNICPKFYNYVRKHGWDNFKLGILEYIDVYKYNIEKKSEIRRVILDREQFYLNKINPTLNINKTAGSTLGYKHTEEKRITMGLHRRGVKINWSRENYIVSNVTKDNLSLRARNGIIVKVFDDNNNIINVFPSITSAAKYYDLRNNTLSKYIKQRYLYKNLRFEGELKDVRVWVFDKERNIIGVFSTANKAAEFCNMYHVVLHRYLKSGKLWNNKYYFSRTDYCV